MSYQDIFASSKAENEKPIIVGNSYDRKSESKISKLEIKLAELKSEHTKLKAELGGDDSNLNYDHEMKRHIKQLKTYNELKDLSMGLIQIIADQRHVTLRAIMDEMGIEDDK
jgi:hypothetical protein